MKTTYRLRPHTTRLFTTLCIALLVSGCGEREDTYPGSLGIRKTPQLSEEQRAAEARFAKYLTTNTDAAIGNYAAIYGKVINTDDVRKLSRDYAPGGPEAMDDATQLARTQFNIAVLEPSRALAREMFRRALSERPFVLFSAGGAGSGKTTGIRNAAGLKTLWDKAQIVYDTTLSDTAGSLDRIEMALKANKDVRIVFVHRDPVEAFTDGVLKRAHEVGRTVEIDEFITTHLRAPETLFEVAKKYASDGRVEITVLNNSLGADKAEVADLAFLKAKSSAYTADALRTVLRQVLDDAYDKGKRGEKGGISKEIYEASLPRSAR